MSKSLMIFFIALFILAFVYFFIFCLCHAAGKESRYKEQREREKEKKIRPTGGFNINDPEDIENIYKIEPTHKE